ncbi:MAG: glycosyltransferase [Phycisphaerae bacterium]|nr:glycosyltransferase [Phycisphaerae bacterium]
MTTLAKKSLMIDVRLSNNDVRMAESRTCVVLVVDDLGYGGAERQVVELANNMDSGRFDVHVCALSDNVPLSSTLTGAEQRLHVIKKGNRCDFTVVPRVARLLRELNAHVVHGFLFSAEIASRLAGHLAGTRLIVGSERNANRPMARRHVLAYRLTQRYVDIIVANSNAGAESNGRIFKRPLSAYRVVHNGVDTKRFRPADGTEIRRRLGIPASVPVVGVFANFKKQKNHPMTFRAFRRVLEAFPDARLLLVGDPPADSRGQLDAYYVELHRLVDELRIRERCMFVGHQDTTEHLYPACDVTVLSSYHEGTPNVLLESMACGVPVVATRVCDNEYIVKEGEVGHLVDVNDDAAMADWIGLILGDGARRREMGQNARQWVCDEFSTKRLAEKMADVYTELLGRGNGRHS